MESLNGYGTTFQLKLLAALIIDKKFISQVQGISLTDFIDAGPYKWVIDKCVEFYRTYKDSPSPEFLQIELSKEPDSYQVELKRVLGLSIQFVDSSDLDYVKTEVINFCKNKAVSSALLKSVGHLERGEFDDIRALMVQALSVGNEPLSGVDYSDSYRARYTEKARVPLPTGWPEIDELMKGGLGGGELGLIIAPLGIGKTWGLVYIGSTAAKLGKKVLHISLELNQFYVGNRYDTVILGKSYDDIIESLDSTEPIIRQYAGHIHIVKMAAKKVTIHYIEDYIENLIDNNFTPDIIVIDYADLMKLNNDKSKRKDELLEDLYIDLRNSAEKYDVPIWTASQTNRDGMKDKFVQNQDVAESIGKLFTADFVMTINRSEQDKTDNLAKVAINKNRFGDDGVFYSMRMNARIGEMTILKRKMISPPPTGNTITSSQASAGLTLLKRLQGP